MSDGCEICFHQSHRAGECENCNCGESEIVEFIHYEFFLEKDFGDYLNYLWNLGYPLKLKTPIYNYER